MLEWATKLRRQKVQKRLLVVGEYRVYSIVRVCTVAAHIVAL